MLLVDVYHPVEVFYHEYVMLLKIFLQLVAAFHFVTSVQVNVAEKLLTCYRFGDGTILFDLFIDPENQPTSLRSPQSPYLYLGLIEGSSRGHAVPLVMDVLDFVLAVK